MDIPGTGKLTRIIWLCC